ncbi:MAG: hypothetical protein M1817_004179 [Caeruleum heppii]|nr:MAG: hypothetical protein M1817_004179 [Caeruleum heppii]
MSTQAKYKFSDVDMVTMKDTGPVLKSTIVPPDRALSRPPEADVLVHAPVTIRSFKALVGDFNTDETTIMAMCRGFRFDVTVALKDLVNSRFAQDYFRLVTKMDETANRTTEDERAIRDWMLGPCLEIVGRLTSRLPRLRVMTLQDFYYPPMHRVKLVVDENRLSTALQESRQSVRARNLTMPSRSLAYHRRIPRIKASKVTILTRSRSRTDGNCETPEKVRLEDGSIKHFIPGDDSSEVLREVKAASHIRAAGLAGKLRVSQLHSIVMSADSKWIVGVLLDWIPPYGRLVDDPESPVQHGQRWRDQIVDTVKTLHKHGIMWGNVHPENILIDTHNDAWVLKIGNRSPPVFGDIMVRGAVQSDMMGMVEIFGGVIWEQVKQDWKETIKRRVTLSELAGGG